MKRFVGVILGVGLYHIELLPKGIGGQACRRLLKSMLKNVISVRDTSRTFTNLEGS